MKEPAKDFPNFKKYLANPLKSVRQKGWESPFASMGLVVALFAVGLLVGFVAIPQLKAHIFSSPTLSLRSETIDGMKVTSDLQPAVTKQAADFLKASIKSNLLPPELLIGKADKASNKTGQEYVALWNADGKSWTMLVVVQDPKKPAVYLRVWYVNDEQNFDENSGKNLLTGVFNDGVVSSDGEVKCQSVDDLVGKMQVCGAMKESSGQKNGVLVRGLVKLSDTKKGTAVSACAITKDHPSYKDATYCP